MERASGWYKRKAQLVLTIVAVVFAVGLNIDSVQIATRLYNDDAVRTAVTAKVDTFRAPQQAADAVSDVKQLQLPVGWGTNTPKDLKGWLSGPPPLRWTRGD